MENLLTPTYAPTYLRYVGVKTQKKIQKTLTGLNLTDPPVMSGYRPIPLFFATALRCATGLLRCTKKIGVGRLIL